MDDEKRKQIPTLMIEDKRKQRPNLNAVISFGIRIGKIGCLWILVSHILYSKLE